MQLEVSELIAPQLTRSVGEGFEFFVDRVVFDREAVVHRVSKPSCHFAAELTTLLVCGVGS
jgi:hypothetical protein